MSRNAGVFRTQRKSPTRSGPTQSLGLNDRTVLFLDEHDEVDQCRLSYAKSAHMATLYVENVPDDVYEALRKRAFESTSIAAEVISLLKQNFPTEAELKRRSDFYDQLAELRAKEPLTPGTFPSAEEMIREDRER